MFCYQRFILLLVFVSLGLTLEVSIIKPRFPQQFIATISSDQGSYAGQYPCLFDSINKREKCQVNNRIYRIRNFSNNTITETNYTIEFPSQCNISTSINDAKLLDPNWFDKLNLSLISADPNQYSWMFMLKKPTLLEELPFAPKYIIQQIQDRQQQIPLNKLRNIMGEIYTSHPDFTWPKRMIISFEAPGYECPLQYMRGPNQSCRQYYSWTFSKQLSLGIIESGIASVAEMFDILFSLPSFLPPCQDVDNQNTEEEEEDD